MAEIGLQLKIERERRRLPRADVSRAIGVYIHHIAALEHGDWSLLPEDAVVAGFVRSYAEHLGFDADAAVADFARQRGIELPPPPESPAGERTPAPADEVEETTPAEPPPPEKVVEEAASVLPSAAEEPRPAEPQPVEVEPVPSPESIPGSRGRKIPLWPFFAAGAVILVIVLWLGLGGSGEERTQIDAPARPIPPPQTAAASESTTEPGSEPTPQPTATASAAPAPVAGRSADAQPDEPASPPPPADGAAVLTVTEYGVGTGVRNHQLVGAADRFKAGTKVWFWTRVRGGSPGTELRHVWLHEGRVIDATTLRIGSSNWRTQSAKTLYSEGSWVVEARDEAGRVLARSELTSTR